MTNFAKVLDEEKLRVKRLKTAHGQSLYDGPDGNDKALKVVNKSVCSCKELIDHMVSETTKFYEGTCFEGNGMFSHDALATFTEAGSQRYLTELGWGDRWLRAVGQTNSEYPHYRRSVVGNRPELCRGLDAHCFSDFERIISHNVSLSSVLRTDDVRRCDLGTPRKVQSTMERCWPLIPSKRIVEDILDFERILHKIVELKGAILTDEAKRSGRRKAPANPNAMALRHKTRNRQQIGTQMASESPLLPELHDAYVLCSCEQLDFFAACGDAAEHERENDDE